MTVETPVEKVFKFVSVRPPAPTAEPRIFEGFVPYEGFINPESLIERVIQLDWPAAKALAVSYLDYAPTVVDFQGLGHAAGLIALRSAIERRSVLGLAIGDIERLLGAKVDAAVNQSPFLAAREALRDVYAAHSLLPRDRPEQREKVLLSLRTLHFLQLLTRDPGLLGDRRRLERILRARVILPGEFLQKKSGAPADQVDTSVAPAAPPTGSSAPYFNQANLERLKGLYAIKHELSAATRRDRRERTLRPADAAPSAPGGLPAPAALPAASPPGGGALEGTPHPGEAVVSGSTNTPPSRLLSPAVVRSLSTQTLDFLTRNGMLTDHLNVDDGLRAVGAEIRGLRTLVFQGVPTSTMVAVDRLVAPGNLGDMVVHDLPGDLETAPAPAPDPVGTTPSSGTGPVRPLGIGQLLLVEQTLQKYAAGEISYVENVLQTESFKRSFRSLNRSVETVFTSTATTDQSERDLQSTNRFELTTQAQKTLSQDMSTQAGMTMSASYGPVSVGAYADFASGTSTTDSTSSAVTFAQDVTDRSVSSITTEVREERTTRIVQESEETSEHGFDNTDGQGNVAGIYQWLDKKYVAQIYDYGPRLMFEFLVPTPAAFYRHALANRPMTGVSLTEPDPLGDLQPSDLTEDNYQDYVAKYAVSGATAPPPETTIVGAVFEQSGLKQNNTVSKTVSLEIPRGYLATTGRFAHELYHFAKDHEPSLTVIIGTSSMNLLAVSAGKDFPALYWEDRTIPVGVIGSLSGMIVTIEVECERSDAAEQDWQQDTYDAIVAAYNAQKSAYDTQVSAAGFAANSTTLGGSETENRRIEKEELKKGSLTMLARQYFENFDAMHLTDTASGFPEFDVDEAIDEGTYAQFFEQAFEWDQITYLYYPYFWMEKAGWVERSSLQSSDALFAEFLRAGYARVVVPVTPAYDDAVLFYLSSGGRIWNGGDAPIIDDPLYVSIVDELSDPTEGRSAFGKPWDVTIPTTLVYLKADSTLPDWTTDAA